MNLVTKPMSVLVAMHNALNAAKPATMKTFSQRSKAVERITALAEAQGINIGKHFDDEGNVKPPAPVEPAKVTAPKAAPKAKADKAPAEPKVKAPSIRAVAEEMLLEVVGLDENKRKVGVPYEDIIAKIKAQFPEAKTTVACLRWYAVHMRERDVLPPNRPRATPKKVEA